MPMAETLKVLTLRRIAEFLKARKNTLRLLLNRNQASEFTVWHDWRPQLDSTDQGRIARESANFARSGQVHVHNGSLLPGAFECRYIELFEQS